MPTEKQLTNLKVLSSVEAREFGKKGGIASAQARKEKKLFKQIINEQLNTLHKNSQKTVKELTIDKLLDFINSTDIRPNEYIKIMEFIRDTVGEKPIDNSNIIINQKSFKEFITEIE